tara:strand:+ start:189 stop:380 length:192 start_codon:yes stop_codon:yes gene_type:complete
MGRGFKVGVVQMKTGGEVTMMQGVSNPEETCHAPDPECPYEKQDCEECEYWYSDEEMGIVHFH